MVERLNRLDREYYDSYISKKEELESYYEAVAKKAEEHFLPLVTRDEYARSVDNGRDYFLSIHVYAGNVEKDAVFAEAYLDPNGWKVALFDYQGKRNVRSRLEKAGILTAPSTDTYHRENRVPLTGLIDFKDTDLILNELERAVFLLRKYFPEHLKK